MSLQALTELAVARVAGQPLGITSVCSAHPLVLRAALRAGAETGAPVLIEATCNQVNHQGGYTGMTPQDFADLVFGLAAQEGCPKELIILGGDHLGPNPWRDRPAEDAMAEAEKMVAAYVAAGFRKIHLDCSMGAAGEPEALDDETTARRAARLAKLAEAAATDAGGDMPVYVIGTEVPPPGGADHVLDTITPTSPEAARRTIDIHRKVFAEAGLTDALSRVIALVVQPGVEFGNQNVIFYRPELARDLAATLAGEPALIFEAHSTDYQGTGPLSDLVADGFAILKVGPELTFVLREALYALDLIASDLDPAYGDRPLMAAMEAEMQDHPANWQRHYAGDPAKLRMLRHYSLSDRIRYYWPSERAEKAVKRLFDTLKGRTIPLPLLWQHLNGRTDLADGPLNPEEVVVAHVRRSLDTYHAACRAGSAPDYSGA
ncbi:D-tagatose-bisphosphate aldolase, class II, non-catalytic subunit [Paracoccus xiamenensis]|uniref:D-tagatose-bisphosphate aldolase, class II, non-catalytic subunit n=1 Tax=Paracoccus xiamenensis TaxID=2714901 RepID=UPI00140B4CC5|nr:D-tagatose-bisphosphate aldolase, class II, non-catalytic subunit [Paracoccus xiamenensis]NHF72345.1 D-tagatose-bisphosphate aldolase, class II, non-catalytic subunit [Paracoccus xiamenensis]